jgi:hypothetical protein
MNRSRDSVGGVDKRQQNNRKEWIRGNKTTGKSG